MPQWKCPTCGNVADVGAQDLVTVCPYCRTCYTVDGAIIREHFLVPMYYSSSQAIEHLILWIKKQIGAEEDLPLHLEVVSTSLDYYPFWHINVSGETTFSGVGEDATYSWAVGPNTYRSIHRTSKPETGSIDRGFSLTYPAAATLPTQLLTYQFPTRSRKYFSEAYAKEYGGRVHNGILTQTMVEERARTDATHILGEFIAKEIFQVNSRRDQVNLLSIFYLHVPIWHLPYKYRNKNYEAYVDASTGRIIHATYPVSLEHRTFTGTLAAAHTVLGFVVGGLLSRISSLATLGAIIGFLAVASVFAVRALRFGRGKEEAK